MTRSLPRYLHTLRKRHGFTQAEIALLLGYSKSMISKLETLASKPAPEAIVGCEVIFGEHPRDIFPALYEEIEDAVGRRAVKLYERLEKKSDSASWEKMRFLLAMIERVEGEPS